MHQVPMNSVSLHSPFSIKSSANWVQLKVYQWKVVVKEAIVPIFDYLMMNYRQILRKVHSQNLLLLLCCLVKSFYTIRINFLDDLSLEVAPKILHHLLKFFFLLLYCKFDDLHLHVLFIFYCYLNIYSHFLTSYAKIY